MKKTYENPQAISILLSSADVISTSGETPTLTIDDIDVQVSALSAWFGE